MRKSLMPSALRAGTGGDPGRRFSKPPIAGPGLEEEVVRRVSICGDLYNERDLTPGMREKVTDVFKQFKRPAQDLSKVQLFDPDRANKRLGGGKLGGPRPERRDVVAPTLQLAPAPAPAEEDFKFEPLELWRPPDPEPDAEAAEPAAEGGAPSATPKRPPPVTVDPILCRFLRPHQREGVQFLFDCTMGLREYEGAGCILADDMGLGKTLQSITILWTLMCQGLDGKPAATHTIVACPVSLVTNWESELNKKWIGEARLRQRGIDVIAVSEAKKHEVVMMVKRFIHGRSAILIISYETFRIHQNLFKKGNQCGLLICDEAHRLKNKDTKTAQALGALSTRRRILLSGTPIQNDLDEFYSMVHFANPDLLGTEKDFHRIYQNPILRGREPDATEKDRERGEGKSAELGRIVNQFILRRTNNLLSDHLPPKLVCIVCCSMSAVQHEMYRTFLSSKHAKQIADGGKQTMVLASITSLKKLCNHPSLVFEQGKPAAGFESCLHLYPELAVPLRRGESRPVQPELSGKFHVLHKLLRHVKATSDDRVVLVSNYTQTLDLFERMCQESGWPCCKLDGSCSIKKRTKMVEDFNNPQGNLFAFLLSSKAGGCGLNLIGGNRLVLFDPDWNPANDKQAAARVWRDGQKKQVYLYRMVVAGTIEEKVFERQLSKEGLSGIATNEQVESSTLSSEELRDLFTLHEDCPSHLHLKLQSNGLISEDEAPTADTPREQVGWPKETGDMHLWAHHLGCQTVDDKALRVAGAKELESDGAVSFVFSLHVKGMDLAKLNAPKPAAGPAAAAKPKAAGSSGEGSSGADAAAPSPSGESYGGSQSGSQQRRTKGTAKIEAALPELRMVVGDGAPEATLRALLARSGGNVGAAANAFFDGAAAGGAGEQHAGASSSAESRSGSGSGGGDATKGGRKRLSLSKRPRE